ncbi:MAG: putative deoxyribonuclease YcfH [Syntrophaceae bacterium PtaU1.Bin231]|nr:MAG: putative deoxyribonuclease YcfH [Syntrophaceae bacterium PtaU1.Bin231]
MSLFDSHCHLEMGEFDADREAVLERAFAAGVRRIVTVGTTLEDAGRAVAIAERHPGVYAAVGVHPHEVRAIGAGTYDALKKLAASPKVVAYGEIGLDFFRNRSPREVQLARFREQLEIAADLDLPVIIHDREAHAETLAILSGRPGRRGGVFHCFSGDRKMAERCMELGFHLSIPGAVTFPKAESLRDVVRDLPLSRLLVETDAPYLSPVPNRGKRNEPAFVVHTAAKVAEIRGIPPAEVAEATTRNAMDVFGICGEEGKEA